MRLHSLRLRAVLLLLVACVCTSCASPAQPTVSETSSCSYAATGAGLTDVSPDGGLVQVSVRADAGCAWTATLTSDFMQVSSGASGSGNGTVEVQVAANTGAARTATLRVANLSVSITQRAVGTASTSTPAPATPCTYALGSATASFDSGGGTASVPVRVVSGTGCTWNATPRDSFITMASGATGSGEGQAVVSVAPNGGGARTGSVSIAGLTFSVTQSAGSSCITSLSVSAAPISGFGGTGTLTVTAPSNCGWSASSPDAFITVPPTTKAGDGTLTFSVASHTATSPRTGTVAVGSRTATVTQAARAEMASLLSFTGSAGDFVSQGRTRRFAYTRSSDVLATLTDGGGRLLVQFPVADGAWSVQLNAAPGGVLTAGMYAPLTRQYSPRRSLPGLSIGGDARGCSSIGRFLIAELVVTDGQVRRLHALFEQRCESMSPGLVGEVWLDGDGISAVPSRSLPATPTSPTTFVTMTGDAGSYVLPGRTLSYTVSNATVQASLTNTVRITLWDVPVGAPSIAFGAPGPSPPGVGAYTGTVSSSATSAPLLDVSSCSGTGSFNVLEASYGSGDTANIVFRFRATFEYRCSGATGSLRGEVFIVADPWR